MSTNQILQFAGGGSANVLSPSAYAALTSIVTNGFSAGIAPSVQLNTVWRQSSFMSNMVAQFIVNNAAVDVNDDGNAATLLTNYQAALTAFIQSNGMRFPTTPLAFAVDTTLTLVQLGGYGSFTAASKTLTLPALSTVTTGKTFTLSGGAYGGTLKGNAAELVFAANGVSANTYILGIGETIQFVSNGTTGWVIVDDGFGLNTFASVQTASGYQKLPGGLIMQWKAWTQTTGGVLQSLTFPLAFPSNLLFAVVGSETATATTYWTSASLSSVSVASSSTGGFGRIYAIGN